MIITGNVKILTECFKAFLVKYKKTLLDDTVFP